MLPRGAEAGAQTFPGRSSVGAVGLEQPRVDARVRRDHTRGDHPRRDGISRRHRTLRPGRRATEPGGEGYAAVARSARGGPSAAGLSAGGNESAE